MGIGENGHIAFNDPHVAEFNDPKTVKAVGLDAVCRNQQVNDGCFASLEEVPKFALTLKEPYKSMNLTYVEQDPYNTMWRREALPGLKDGFDYIPCASTYYNVERNTSDIVEYFKTNAPDDQILGYMTAPWATTLPTEYSKHHIDTSLRLMKEAKEAFYK